MDWLVGLTARYSHPGTSTQTATTSINQRNKPLTTTTVRQSQIRLDAGQVAALCDQYRSGLSLTGLAKKFGIHKRTVSAHLARNNIERRPTTRKMTDTQTKIAAELRRSGWPLCRLGQHFGVDPSTVRKEIDELNSGK